MPSRSLLLFAVALSTVPSACLGDSLIVTTKNAIYAGWSDHPHYDPDSWRARNEGEVVASRDYVGNTEFDLTDVKRVLPNSKISVVLPDSGGTIAGTVTTRITTYRGDGRFTNDDAATQGKEFATTTRPFQGPDTVLDIKSQVAETAGGYLGMHFRNEGGGMDAFGSPTLRAVDDAWEILANTKFENLSTDHTAQFRWQFYSSLGVNVSLDAMAKALGFDHFNFISMVIRDSAPPPTASGHIPVVPYLDPPLGGYEYQKFDNLSFYWNERPGFDSAYGLDAHVGTQDGLHYIDFEDTPFNRTPFAPGDSLGFKTWLVGVLPRTDGSDLQPGYTILSKPIYWDSNYSTLDNSGGIFNVRSNLDGPAGPTVGGVFGVSEGDYNDISPEELAIIRASGGQFLGTAAVPEPSSFVLAGLGLLGALACRRAGSRLRKS